MPGEKKRRLRFYMLTEENETLIWLPMGSTSLLLPKNQEIEFQGRKYKTDEDGMFITRSDRPLVDFNEDSYDATHIYPGRIGTVSEVITVDAAKHFL